MADISMVTGSLTQAVEFKNPQGRIALFRTLVMAAATLCSLVGWVVLRWPYDGLTNALGPLLVSCASMAGVTKEARRGNFFRYLFFASLVQFGRGWLSYSNFLSLMFVAIAAFMVHKFIKSSLGASSVMAAGMMEVGIIDFSECANAAITLWIVGLAIAWIYALIERFFPLPENMEIFPESPPFSNRSIFRRVLMFSTAYFLVEITGWEESFWFTLSVSLACSGGDTGIGLRYYALLRGFWAPIGLILAIAVMQTFAWSDFRWNYLVFFVGIGAFYILHRFGNYVIFYLLFLLMLTGVDNLVSSAEKYGNPVNYFFQALFCIVGGTFVVLLIAPSRKDYELRKS